MAKLKTYPGEKTSLLFSLLLTLFAAYVLLGISTLLFFFIILLQLIYILIIQRQFFGNALQITKYQFKDIYNIARENARNLAIKMPKVFIVQDPYLNAFTIGFKSPYTIVLTSSLVESLTRDEIDFIIGHEMGHIKFGHSRILSFISPVGRSIPFVSWLYGFWRRKAEYSADRVGLIVTPKIKPAIQAILKMTVGRKLAEVIDINEIIQQIEETEATFLSTTGESFLSHPYVMNRIKALAEFYHFNK